MRASARGPPDAIRGHQMSSEVISVRAPEALPMGHVARREEMYHRPDELLELALDHEIIALVGRPRRLQQDQVGDHPRTARKVELAAHDGAVGHHVLAQLAGELGLAPLHFRMQEALEERAKEVRVTNLMRWTIGGQ